MGKLTDKRVLITAGAQGIGKAISRGMLEAGAQVAVHYFNSSDAAEKLRAKYPGKVMIFRADLTNKTEAEKMVSDAAAALGGIDCLINNVGSLVQRVWTGDINQEIWQKVFDVNLSSMMWITQAAVPFLEQNKASSIVNLSSLAGRKGGHGGSLIYSIMKGGIITMTRALGTELGVRGIRVNAVAPGLICGTSFHDTHTTKASVEETINGIPLARAGTPEDVAKAVVFLASEYDGFINGAILDVNGGVY
jgi:3-oxoacyl-[acyl-carrier protein] reductase